ncbi:hypothetical protein EVG20_g3549 [Dentipellis fragilis]|uniref:Uncharacterized protein n=1 Tax=Dentipellis fragilis TaxID=205917 RepID=A0A4Y9Z0Z1_9AGAM|nr:hypothetical protein EVG20_g3549 [Dentipellis fragilis]
MGPVSTALSQFPLRLLVLSQDSLLLCHLHGLSLSHILHAANPTISRILPSALFLTTHKYKIPTPPATVATILENISLTLSSRAPCVALSQVAPLPPQLALERSLVIRPYTWYTSISLVASMVLVVATVLILRRHFYVRELLHRSISCFVSLAQRAQEALDVAWFQQILSEDVNKALRRRISLLESEVTKAHLVERDIRLTICKLEQALRQQKLAAEQQALQSDKANNDLLEQKSQVQSERDALRERLKGHELHFQAIEAENSRLRQSVETFLCRQQSSVTIIAKITHAQQRKAKARDADKDRLLDEASVKVAGLLDRVATLVRESTAKGAALDGCETQLDGAFAEIRDLRSAKVIVEEQSADLQRQLQLSVTTVEQLTVARAAVEEQSVRQASLLADRQGQLDRAHGEIQELLGVKAAVQKAYSDRGVLLDSARTEIAELVVAKVAIEEACSEQKAQLVGLKEALLAERGDDLDRAHTQVEELVATKTAVEEELEEHKGDLAAMMAEVQRLTSEVADTREQLAAKEAVFAELQVELDGAREESRASSVARAVAVEESAENSALSCSCRSSLNAAHLEIQLLASANASVIQQVAEVRSSLGYAEDDVKGLMEDFAALSAVLSERDKQLCAKDEKCRELQRNADVQEALLLDYKSSKASMTAAIEELQSKLDSWDTEEQAVVDSGFQKEHLDEITVQLTEARAEVQRKDVEVAALASELELIRADLSASKAREDKIEKKLASKRLDLKEEREKFLELQFQVGALRAETAFTQTQHSELRSKYKIIRETFLEMEAELRGTQTELADAEAKALRHAKAFSSLAEKDELIQSLEACILELTGAQTFAPISLESPAPTTEKSYAPSSPSPLGPLPMTPPATPPALRPVQRSSSSDRDVPFLRACVLLREASRSSNIPVPKGSPEDGVVKPATEDIVQDQA